MAIKDRKYGTGRLILDTALVFLTGGLWLIWLLVRFLRK